MKAFPTTKPLDSWDDPNQGMDLRDYFAAQAMLVVKSSDYASTAECCYKLADAMMKAREKC
jgi:hypothetical protein